MDYKNFNFICNAISDQNKSNLNTWNNNKYKFIDVKKIIDLKLIIGKKRQFFFK